MKLAISVNIGILVLPQVLMHMGFTYTPLEALNRKPTASAAVAVAQCDVLRSSTRENSFIFFPASGYRRRLNNALNWVGREGHYWMSSAWTSDSAFRLVFSLGGVEPWDGYHRSYGYSVRCYGYRNYVWDGDLRDVDNIGRCYLSSAATIYNAYHLLFYYDDVWPHNGNFPRCNAFSVRLRLSLL